MSSAPDHWYVPALNGLRAIAVLVVIFCHTTPHIFEGGHIGVDLFFVLSGFLITTILLNEFNASGTINIRFFYYRRALRLFPALALVIVFVFLHAWFTMDWTGFAGTLKDLAAVATYVWNWRLVWLIPRGLSSDGMLTHLWSLSVEEQFYIVWPLLLLTVLRLRASTPVLLGVLALGVLGPWIGRLLLWKAGPQFPIYFSTHLHVDGLAWGASLAWIVSNGYLPQSRRLKTAINILANAALVLFLYLCLKDRVNDGGLYQWGFTLVGLLSVVMIANTMVNPDAVFTKVLEWRPINYIGAISYGLYLWHVPILRILIPGYSALFHAAVCVSATFVIAALSFKYWEAPFLRLKSGIGYPDTAKPKEIPEPMAMASRRVAI
jgi:peptidoglycan/LPS O-acetylase OafA/YrhL